jgi:hypothetical protein
MLSRKKDLVSEAKLQTIQLLLIGKIHFKCGEGFGSLAGFIQSNYRYYKTNIIKLLKSTVFTTVIFDQLENQNIVVNG